MNRIPAHFEICKKEEVKSDFPEPKEVLLPQRASLHSAGYDFYCPFDVEIKPGEEVIIPSYIKCLDMPENTVLKLYIRSSLGIKRNLALANGTGIIDADYTWCIYVALVNYGNKTATIQAGERFAQGIFETYAILENDHTSSQREGGIGSTGK